MTFLFFASAAKSVVVTVLFVNKSKYLKDVFGVALPADRKLQTTTNKKK